MQITEDGYLLSRGVTRTSVRRNKNKVLEFIRVHRVIISISFAFIGVVLLEGVLLTRFISLLSTL